MEGDGMALYRVFCAQYSIARGLLATCSQNPCMVGTPGKATSSPSILCLPEPPKKPMQPFIRFAIHHQADVRRAFPDVPRSAIKEKVMEMWNNLSNDERQYWSKEYEKEKVDYDMRYSEYLKTVTPRDLEVMKRVKDQEARKKARRVQARVRKEQQAIEGKPKAPGNAFFLFMMRQDSGGLKRKDFLFEVGKMWKCLPEEERRAYHEEAERLKEQYVMDLAAWEDKMAKAGRLDLIRPQQQLLYKLFETKHQPLEHQTLE
ncbi:hypothetical protein Pmani_023858 [Petrolisthes manimaculis]|uniref:HMG box domain-containing protein n=1 Tax=Petrolisthes manimaculis TaxID=1843537 RepID=A0AAE1PBA6_9EUCA|nr:hypothetical protein Pmani_023858 [Petrolisthes manimaculis]